MTKDFEAYNMNQRWVDTQHTTFTNWCNSMIQKNEARRNKFHPMTDLVSGLHTGVNLAYLAEQITHKEARNLNENPFLRIQKISNIQEALTILENDHIKLVNISAAEICDGNLKIILGLIWAVIRHAEASLDLRQEQSGRATSSSTNAPTVLTPEPTSSERSTHQKLFDWIHFMTGIRPTNFTTDFQDGRILMKLVQRIQRDEGRRPIEDSDQDAPLMRVTKAVEAAQQDFQIPVVMKPLDITNAPDELSFMTYLISIKIGLKEYKVRLEQEYKQNIPTPSPVSRPPPPPHFTKQGTTPVQPTTPPKQNLPPPPPQFHKVQYEEPDDRTPPSQNLSPPYPVHNQQQNQQQNQQNPPYPQYENHQQQFMPPNQSASVPLLPYQEYNQGNMGNNLIPQPPLYNTDYQHTTTPPYPMNSPALYNPPPPPQNNQMAHYQVPPYVPPNQYSTTTYNTYQVQPQIPPPRVVQQTTRVYQQPVFTVVPPTTRVTVTARIQTGGRKKSRYGLRF